MKISGFKVDQDKAENGIVRKFDVDGKCYVRVARANNSQFESELRRQIEPYKNFRRSKVPTKIIDECTKKAMAKAILVEMVGFTDDKGDITGTPGAAIENTEENRFKVLSHKDYGDFLELVSSISGDFDSYKTESDEEDEGNFVPSSAGPGPGAKKKPS